MDPYLETLASYAPKLVVNQLLENPAPIYEPRIDHLPAVVLFADISGFTPLTEALVQDGLEGLETLSTILNRYFGGIIDLILANGGDILKFAGDALLAAWSVSSDTTDLSQVTQWAAQCALAIQDYSRNYVQSGHVELKLCISVGAGELCISHVGGRLQRWEYSVSGASLTQMRYASELTDPGCVVLSGEAWQWVAKQAVGKPLVGDHWQLLSVAHLPYIAAAPLSLEVKVEAGLRNYIPGAILDRLIAGHSEWLAEYRRVTLLFIKLPTLSKTVCLQQLQGFMEDAQAALYHYEGSISKISVDNKGTALMAAFGLPPFAHENDPERALKAALKLQGQMQEKGWPCSIGISSGNVFCGTIGNDRRREYTMIGDVVNLAARLLDVAGSRILCDRNTYIATQSRLAFRSLPPVHLKGMEQREEISVFQPLGFLQPHLVPAATLIGADQERQHLIQAAEHLLTHHQGQIAVIEGDAGLGKSQLLANFLQWTTIHDLPFAIGAAEAVEQFTPYYAWRQILHKLFGLKDIRNRVKRGHHLCRIGFRKYPSLLKLAPLLNLVLDIDLPETTLTQQIQGKVRAENIQRLLLHLLQISIQQQPTLLILEDAHWLDSASWTLLLTLQDQNLPLLFVVATRPLTPPPAAFSQLRAAPYTHILQMPVLTRAETQPFLAQQLGLDDVSEAVSDFIYDKAEGHPLFSEEIAFALRDQGYLDIEAGMCRFAPGMQSFQELGLPDTIKGLMTSRFDQLLPVQQLLLKVASVIGRSFFYPLLHEIYPLPEDKNLLLDHLQDLHRQELVLLESSEPQLAYMFRHVMIQEVAYNQMLFAQRRDLHRNIALWYEQHHRDQTSAYGVLAYHWTRTDQPDKALEYLNKAGEQMIQNGSCHEAIEFFSQALEVAPSVPHQSPLQYARWHRQLGEAYLGLGQLQQCETQFLATLKQLGSSISSNILSRWLAFSGQVVQQLWHSFRSTSTTTTALPQPAQQPSRPLATVSTPVRAHRLELIRTYERLGEVFYYSHRRTLAIYASITGLNLAETLGPSSELARIYANTCFAMGLKGYHALAQRYGHLAESTLEQLPTSLPCLGWISLVLGAYNLGRGRWSAAQVRLQSSIDAFTAINDSHHLAEAYASLARVNHCQGYFPAAHDLWQRVHEVGQQHRDFQAQTWGLLGQAEEELAQGQVDRAQALVEESGQWLTRQDDLICDQIRWYGLSALVACEVGDFKRAQHDAGKAMEYIQQSPPIAAYVYESYSGIVQVYYQLWLASEQNPSYGRLLKQACTAMDAYAKAFRMARARALHWRAMMAFTQGHRRKAKHLWQQGLQHATELKMPHEQARIRNAMARHGLLDDDD